MRILLEFISTQFDSYENRMTRQQLLVAEQVFFFFSLFHIAEVSDAATNRFKIRVTLGKNLVHRRFGNFPFDELGFNEEVDGRVPDADLVLPLDGESCVSS